MGISDRGTLEINKLADIVVLDYGKIKDNSKFEDSVARPSGIEHIFIEGKPSVLNGRKIASNLGRVL